MVKGQILKIHSDFYYVLSNGEVFECKLREVLKKQGEKPLVGDFVLFENGAISEIFPRKNYIPRPAVANVDQVIIVSALKSPELNYSQLNRYIAFAEYYGQEAVLCFNKDDLLEDSGLLNEVKDIYLPLGYKIIFTSAKENHGITEFLEVLKSKNSVLCGSSGVGKSSLINAVAPWVSLRTKEVSERTLKGTHTTRHSEIIQISEDTRIIDTPGFSNLKFEFLLPQNVDLLFREMREFREYCKYPDCLHISESDCSILEHLDTINETRYQSYLEFVEEAKVYKNKVKYEGKKVENRSKFQGAKVAPKISIKKRNVARNTAKQNIFKELEDGNTD